MMLGFSIMMICMILYTGFKWCCLAANKLIPGHGGIQLLSRTYKQATQLCSHREQLLLPHKRLPSDTATVSTFNTISTSDTVTVTTASTLLRTKRLPTAMAMRLKKRHRSHKV